MMKNEHGVEIIPVEEELRRTTAIMERERNKPPYKGQERFIRALEERIAIYKARMARERKSEAAG